MTDDAARRGHRPEDAPDRPDAPRGEGGGEDPGAYLGHEPERATESLPEPLSRDDVRVAAHSTRPTGVGRPDERGQPIPEPGGHRDGPPADDDAIREAGETG